jgi:hypothetical protein
VTDELFDYFGKGSKKFEPLDDDLDLPEVSPKRPNDSPDDAIDSIDACDLSDSSDSVELVNQDPGRKPDQVKLETPAAAQTNARQTPETGSPDNEDDFGGFGAGLFDDDQSDLPPRRSKADAPADKPTIVKDEPVAPVRANDVKTAKKATPKPEKTSPAPVADEIDAILQPIAEPPEAADAEGGTWDFLAGMLGIGGKAKTKSATTPAAEPEEVEIETFDSNEELGFKPVKSSASESPVQAMFDEPASSDDEKIDSLFNASDDELDLIGWGDDDDADDDSEDDIDDEEEVVAEKPTPEKSRSRRGRSRGRREKQSEATDDDELIDAVSEPIDEDFIEFEIEELSPSAKKIESDDKGPRRKRRPRRDDAQEKEEAKPRARRGRKSEDDDEPSDSRRGRRGRGRGRNDRDSEERPSTLAREKSDDWEEIEDDSEDTNEDRNQSQNENAREDVREDRNDRGGRGRSRSRGGRGRGRGRGRSKPNRDEVDSNRDDLSLEDDADLPAFVDDNDDQQEESRPRGRGRSRGNRSRGGRSRPEKDDHDQDAGDRVVRSRDSEEGGDDDSPRRARRRRPRSERDGGRDGAKRERDSTSREKPQYEDVPTWDETIESMIESNIKNHESSSSRRGGGSNSRRGGGGGRRRNNSNNNRR